MIYIQIRIPGSQDAAEREWHDLTVGPNPDQTPGAVIKEAKALDAASDSIFYCVVEKQTHVLWPGKVKK